MPFSKLNLAPNIIKAIKAMGYVDPTPIQLRTIPIALEGHDLIGSAQTGTGKTAAFALPILSRLGNHGALRALILEPTRELAGQVDTAMRDFARFTDLRACAVYGGAGFGQQARELKNGVDVLSATPGRLLDHLTRGTVKLDHIEYLVLDEADRMLDMGFMPDVRRIIERCPKKRQTFVFSATMPPEIESLVRWAMNAPKVVEIGHRRSPAETITHALYPVAPGLKSKLLLALLEKLNFESLLVFTRTKHRADKIARLLKTADHAVAVLHSNRTQRERERALQGFRDGRFDVLVATDIAARGLDVDTITHVINYDIPQHPEDYVHRIGRTGRASSSGDALSIFVSDDIKYVSAIERYIGKKIERKKLEEFDYSAAPEPGSSDRGERHQGQGRHERRPHQGGGGGGGGRGGHGGYGGNRSQGGRNQQRGNYAPRPPQSNAPGGTGGTGGHAPSAPAVHAAPAGAPSASNAPQVARPHREHTEKADGAERDYNRPGAGAPRPQARPNHARQTRQNPRPWEQR